jgi:RNA polymerase sigma-70 factor (ECF subfamily)
LDPHNGARDVLAVSSVQSGRPMTLRRISFRSHGADGDPAPDSDAALAEKSTVEGEAFGVLYDRYCQQVYRYVHRRLRDRETAEDVTAEVFFKALRAIGSYRADTGPFLAWLYRIAANAVIDHVRARKLTLSLDLAVEAADSAAPVDDQVITRTELARVWAAIDQLPQTQRTAVILRYEQDLPIAEIAQRMGRSDGAVKLLLNRGMGAVRLRLLPAEPIPVTTDDGDRP